MLKKQYSKAYYEKLELIETKLDEVITEYISGISLQ
jgi:hypothetical protein